MDFGAVYGDNIEDALFAGVSSAEAVIEQLLFGARLGIVMLPLRRRTFALARDLYQIVFILVVSQHLLHNRVLAFGQLLLILIHVQASVDGCKVLGNEISTWEADALVTRLCHEDVLSCSTVIHTFPRSLMVEGRRRLLVVVLEPVRFSGSGLFALIVCSYFWRHCRSLRLLGKLLVVSDDRGRLRW